VIRRKVIFVIRIEYTNRARAYFGVGE